MTPPKRKPDLLVTICEHCKKLAHQHAGSKCLFEPTHFKPRTLGLQHLDVVGLLEESPDDDAV